MSDALAEVRSPKKENDEYNDESGMALTQLQTAMDAVKELMPIVKSMDNLPEWVQSKLTKSVDYLDTVRDYLKSETKNGEIQEKAVSQSQQKLMAMAYALKKGEMDPNDASDEVKKLADSMSMKDLKDFASTKHDEIPSKIKEEINPADDADKLKDAQMQKRLAQAQAQVARYQEVIQRITNIQNAKKSQNKKGKK